MLKTNTKKAVHARRLASLLGSLPVGFGADQYLPKIDERLAAAGAATRQARKGRRPSDSSSADGRAQGETERERELKSLKSERQILRSLRSLMERLVDLSQRWRKGGIEALRAAESFLTDLANSVNELDAYAVVSLVESIRRRVLWLEQLGGEMNVQLWLSTLLVNTRLMGEGPRPGCLHVASLAAGGHSGRARTFAVGWDDRRLPGAVLQDPILLDSERSLVHRDLATSGQRLHRKIEDVAATLSQTPGRVTISWSCQDVADDRETFPSSLALIAFRLCRNQHEADLETLNNAVGWPASFAPDSESKSLDETDAWLGRLSDERLQGQDHTHDVDLQYPHLARGAAARRLRATEFGACNGWVPVAGADLNPFAEQAPVLSASALETMGRCPRAFFFRNGLRVFPPDETDGDADQWLNAAQQGLLLHDVFRRFMEELGQQDQRPHFDHHHRRLATILHERIDQWRNEKPPPHESAFRTQYWRFVRCCSIFLQMEEEHCRRSQPRFLEVAIGLPSVGDDAQLDRSDPMAIELPLTGSIRTRGQIDRVDQLREGSFSVWDYKISSGYGYDVRDPFRQGRRVQNILYLMMIEKALREQIDSRAVVERFGYFFPSVKAHGWRVEWKDDQLRPGAMVLARLCAAISEGAFPATDDSSDCAYCDYRACCGDLEETTRRSKELLQLAPLPAALRNFAELRNG